MRTLAAALAIGVAVGCAPALAPLSGAPAPAHLPAAELPRGHHKIVFQWEVEDGELTARGDGAARIASPDSARLDFFVSGGLGAGGAVLLGESLTVPGGDMARRLVPPPPLLWAAFGRLALPALPDTVARLDGDLLRADMGRPIVWRTTFRRDSLIRVERVQDGKVVEWVERDGARVTYRHEAPRRTLKLSILRVEETGEFDAAIWRLD